jgi:deoxyribose-phosphate aldolase
MTPSELAKRIDHTLLRADATSSQIGTLCREAIDHGFATVCVAPSWVELVARLLSTTPAVRVATVVGFPHGDTLSQVKSFEARCVLEAGAHEVDMVMAVGALRSGDRRHVLSDIRGVVLAARRFEGALVKVILETGLLDDAQKRIACELALEAGADFVKTSTGFGPAGATVLDVALFREVVGDRMQIKAAGGIRDLATARAMLAAGADRIGASASVRILDELRQGTT